MRLTQTDGDIAVLERLWAAQRKEIMRIVDQYVEMGGKPTQEFSGDGANSYLDCMKQKGYPKGLVRKISGLKTDAAIERHLGEARSKMGLAP